MTIKVIVPSYPSQGISRNVVGFEDLGIFVFTSKCSLFVYKVLDNKLYFIQQVSSLKGKVITGITKINYSIAVTTIEGYGMYFVKIAMTTKIFSI